MDILTICALISSLSFIGYVTAYFTTPYMKSEFKRFGLEKLGLFIIILQALGAMGILVGLFYKPILIIASLGLALLMLAGVIVRIILKDSLLITIPAIFYMLLNAFVFWGSIH